MVDTNYTYYKVQIYPNEKQKEKIWKSFGASRFVYNYAIDAIQDYYEENHKFITKFTLGCQFVQYKQQFPWLLELDAATLKACIFDAIRAFKMFFNGKAKYPGYRTKKKSKPSMYVRPDRLVITEEYITIPGLGKVNSSPLPDKSIIGAGDKGYKLPQKHYYNSRITYDGLNYYISLSLLVQDGYRIASVRKQIKPETQSENIGIDLGCRPEKWIVDSNGNRISLPDTTKEVKKIKRFQRKFNRQLRSSRTKNTNYRSNNTKKTVSVLNKYYKRIRNKKMAKLHDYVSHEIIERNPKNVVIEDITVMDWIRDTKKLPFKYGHEVSCIIHNASLYLVQSIIQYKCAHNGINVIKADKFFPSSQRCSNCGNIKKIRRNKVYKCPVCGYVADRDENAALNLKLYPDLDMVW